MKRRNINVFGLSFLDIMFCGFGSVILLVMIVNSHMIKYREQATSEHMAMAEQLRHDVTLQQTLLAELKNSQLQTEQDRVETQGLSTTVLKEITAFQQQLGQHNQQSVAKQAHIKKLQSDLKIQEQRFLSLQTQQREQGNNPASKLRLIKGDGDRQYLTGIKMGGKRILILVDRSASMLDETLINIILKRNQSKRIKLFAPKWRRVVATVEWLLSQIPSSSHYQVMIFNHRREYLLANKNGWLKASDSAAMDQVMAALEQVVPEQGTSLYHAMQGIGAMRPPPDNVFLLTDGLPTQGIKTSSKSKVSGSERMAYFVDAIRNIPRGLSINTILFPIEGDPLASSAYWKLAVQTKGSFVSPAADWP